MHPSTKAALAAGAAIVVLAAIALVVLITRFPTAFYAFKIDLVDTWFYLKNGANKKRMYTDNDLLVNDIDIEDRYPVYPFTAVVHRVPESIRDIEFLKKEGAMFSKWNGLLTPRNPDGTWVADSLFRMSCKAPGKDRLKRIYVQGFTGAMLRDHHTRVIRDVLERHLSLGAREDLFGIIEEMNSEALWRLHIGRAPTEYELSYVRDMSSGINRLMAESVPFITLDRSYLVWRTDAFLRHFLTMRDIRPGSIVHAWLQAGASREYCYVEMVHNVFAMTIGWTSLSLSYLDLLLDGRIPEPLGPGDLYGDSDLEASKKLYLQAIVHMIMPAPAATSRVGAHTLHVHNLNVHKRSEFDKDYRSNIPKLEPRCPMRACVDRSNAYVPRGVRIASYSDDNVAFGIGCRRCPGEEITLLYLHELIRFTQANDWESRVHTVQKRFHWCGLGRASWLRLSEREEKKGEATK